MAMLVAASGSAFFGSPCVEETVSVPRVADANRAEVESDAPWMMHRGTAFRIAYVGRSIDAGARAFLSVLVRGTIGVIARPSTRSASNGAPKRSMTYRGTKFTM